jgi:hypothetical protein
MSYHVLAFVSFSGDKTSKECLRLRKLARALKSDFVNIAIAVIVTSD